MQQNSFTSQYNTYAVALLPDAIINQDNQIIYGCTDQNAYANCNDFDWDDDYGCYDENATIDNGTCLYY